MAILHKTNSKTKTKTLVRAPRRMFALTPCARPIIWDLAGSWSDPTGNRVCDHFDIENCSELIGWARRYKKLSYSEKDFLDALEERVNLYGYGDAFCSPKQAQWLRRLAYRGGCNDPDAPELKYNNLSERYE